MISLEAQKPVSETEFASNKFTPCDTPYKETTFQNPPLTASALGEHRGKSATFLSRNIACGVGKGVIIFKRPSMSKIQIAVPKKEITSFCQRWKIVEFGLFGSALRDDFETSSDVDVLVSFASDSLISLFDLAQMQIELTGLFGRPVDILEKEGLRNPFRKREILKTVKVIYAA